MRKLLPFSWLAVGFLGCGGVSGPPAPRLIEGGGVGDGKISSALNVYVIDEDSRGVLSSASVRVGESSSSTPCTVLTDSTGLAKFDTTGCTSLKGPATITVSTPNYVPATWIGVNAANVTIPLRPTVAAAVPTATASGTIAGWASLPAPQTNHQTLALIIYSQTNDLGNRANEIMQGKRNVNVNGTDYPIDSNLCVINTAVSNCDWTLTTRTGPQAHIGLIVDQDTKGTDVDTDDTFTVTGYAIKTGLDFAKDDMKTGEVLEMIADVDMQTFTASFASLPSGMDFMGAFPALELGAEGRMPFTTPALDMMHTSTRVPKLTGALAGKTYSLIAQAQDAVNVNDPSSMAWLHGVDINSTVALSSWLPPPSNISVTNGTFAFTPVAGATLHGGEIQNPLLGDRVWSITIFDGSTSFTLPGLAADPIPVGMVRFQSSALQIPGTDLGNFEIDTIKDKIAAISSDGVNFTHP